MYHIRIWLVSSALDSVEGRVWTAHTAIQSRGCQRVTFAFCSLVGDGVAVSRGCVLTRWSSLGHMCTHDHDLCTFSCHGPLITQAVSHSCLTGSNSFVLWKNIGSGAQFFCLVAEQISY